MSKGLFLTEGVALSRGGFRVHCRKDALAPHDEHGVEKVVNGLCDVGLGSQFLPEPNQHQRPNDRVPVEVSHIALLSDASYLLACCLHRIVWRESLRGDRLRSRESQDPRDPAADSGKTLLAGVGSQLGMRKNAPNQKKRARGLGKPRVWGNAHFFRTPQRYPRNPSVSNPRQKIFVFLRKTPFERLFRWLRGYPGAGILNRTQPDTWPCGVNCGFLDWTACFGNAFGIR